MRRLEVARPPARSADNGEARPGRSLDMRLWARPECSVSEHVKDSVPVWRQVRVKAVQRTQHITSGEQIVQRVKVARDKVNRVGELQRGKILKQKARTIAVVLGEGGGELVDGVMAYSYYFSMYFLHSYQRLLTTNRTFLFLG